LQAIAQAAEHIMCGFSEVAIGGGAESMSLLPMGGHNLSPNPTLVDTYPDTYLNMGLTAENLARKYGVTREQADEFSARSHRNAAAAIDAGRFKEEIVPLTLTTRDLEMDEKGRGKIRVKETVFEVDEGVRRDTSAEALAKLRPAFHAKGTVTAGNSSQTSDGGAAALVMSSERADALGLKPMARFVAFATAGVAPEEMGIGPVFAIPKALKVAGLKLEEIDLIELNEAFAAQALSVIKELNLDLERLNVNGGAIALGHPLGATGTRLLLTLVRELEQSGKSLGCASACIGGGQGIAMILERA
jgi:acetyl-CoA acyltransferase